MRFEHHLHPKRVSVLDGSAYGSIRLRHKRVVMARRVVDSSAVEERKDVRGRDIPLVPGSYD